tara:strand:+ start:2471 stop:2977 length:507 start_codon:yes stop_codon:yes gene_type:complete
MGNVGVGSIRIIDNDGESATVTNGKLDVNADLTVEGDINIGNVDVLSVPAPLSTTGDGTRSGVLRITLASDSAMPNTQGYTAIGQQSNVSVSSSDDETIAVSTACKHVDVMAAITNTGIIYVGGEGVSATTGIALYAGDVYSVDIDNVTKIWAIASVNNEDVQFVYYT